MSDRALVLHRAMEHSDLTIQRSQLCVCSVCEGARHRGDAVMRQGWSHHETITVTVIKTCKVVVIWNGIICLMFVTTMSPYSIE